jgi:hypothetical protein
LFERSAAAARLAIIATMLLLAACDSDAAVPPDSPVPPDSSTPPPPVPPPVGHAGLCTLPSTPSGPTVPGSSAPGDIRLDASQRYQTIVGWESHGQAGEDDFADWGTYGDTLVRMAACDLGINRIRLEVQAGNENPVDNYLRWRTGDISHPQWRCLRWTAVNDNADPAVHNPNGFHWTELDRRMERVVLPLRRALEGRGERLYINLTYTGFLRQCSGIPDLHANLDEYAELILATFRHLEQRWGVVPDGVNVVLEPEHTAWTGTQIGRAIVRTAAVLAAAGYRPEFIGPSTTSMANAITYFDEMVAVPGVLDHLKELSYHRYQGVSVTNLQQIAERGRQYGIRTAMLERTSANYRALHDDLKIGNVSAWQQFALAFGSDDGSGTTYFSIDKADSAAPRVVYPARTRYLRQYFRFIRASATRIEATSSRNALDPVAFINADGRYVVVVTATTGAAFNVAGLPAGRYGITYTTAAAFDVELQDVDLSSGESLPASIPAAGVVTIHAR